PASKVEIAHAKVRPIGKVDRLAQGGQKLLFDVIENARHPFCYSEGAAAESECPWTVHIFAASFESGRLISPRNVTRRIWLNGALAILARTPKAKTIIQTTK